MCDLLFYIVYANEMEYTLVSCIWKKLIVEKSVSQWEKK